MRSRSRITCDLAESLVHEGRACESPVYYLILLLVYIT